MKRYAFILFACCAAAALSACGIGTTIALFKPNTPPAVKQADLDKCKIASFRAIPQAYTTQYVGGFYDPGDIDCHRSRHGRNVYCDRVGGFYEPPMGYTEDLNAPIRWRYVSSCLAKKGYYLIYNKPLCSSGAERARALSAGTPADLTCNPDTNLDY